MLCHIDNKSACLGNEIYSLLSYILIILSTNRYPDEHKYLQCGLLHCVAIQGVGYGGKRG